MLVSPLDVKHLFVVSVDTGAVPRVGVLLAFLSVHMYGSQQGARARQALVQVVVFTTPLPVV